MSFGFTKDITILENLNFEILKNKKIGITGESGSGKTTFIDILTGLLKPTKGNIAVDEINIYDANVSSWIKKISFIQQKVFIFNSSLRQNITLVNDNQMIDKKKLDKILELSDLKNFVNSKENLELFNVGEFGNNLSGGQKQKVGLARALYQDTEILILDESTNAIDEKSEKKIIDNILSLNTKTIILITHKIKNLVKDNSILISGDHNEDGARVLNEYLTSLNCNKHLIIGMMVNKDHEKYISYFKNFSSITTVDIPNQPNSISGKKLKDKFKNFSNVNYKESIEGAIKSKKLKHGDLLLITGSLYLCGEVLNLN